MKKELDELQFEHCWDRIDLALKTIKATSGYSPLQVAHAWDQLDMYLVEIRDNLESPAVAENLRDKVFELTEKIEDLELDVDSLETQTADLEDQIDHIKDAIEELTPGDEIDQDTIDNLLDLCD